MAKKTNKTEAQFNMQATHEVELNSDDVLLASLLEGMSGDEVIEESHDEIIDSDDPAAIEAAVAQIEKAEAVQSIYAEEGGEKDDLDHLFGTGVNPADVPTVVDDKPKKEKKAKSPKEPKVPRVTYVGHKPSEVLKAKLGEKAGEMLLLEVSDVKLTPEALEAKQADLLAMLNNRPGSEGGSTQKKVAEKVVMLFNWMKNGGKLNEVMERTFRVLARDGEIISGDKGNLHAELLSKPYSVGTCRAQAGQMMAMLPMLMIATKSEKGKLVANPASLILMKAKAELGLS